jgi:hypothetical protein
MPQEVSRRHAACISPSRERARHHTCQGKDDEVEEEAAQAGGEGEEEGREGGGEGEGQKEEDHVVEQQEKEKRWWWDGVLAAVVMHAYLVSLPTYTIPQSYQHPHSWILHGPCTLEDEWIFCFCRESSNGLHAGRRAQCSIRYRVPLTSLGWHEWGGLTVGLVLV